MMTRIFRVQDSEGRGPWRPGLSHKWSEERPESEYAALVPWMVEFKGKMKPHITGMRLGCGCLTHEQLRRWFTQGEYAKLLGYGYQSVSMIADRILAASDKQCVFQRARPLHEEVEVFSLYPEVTP